MTTPTFSLILATYGRVDEIGRLMDSLAAQTCTDFELIFADQNADDRVLPFVQRAIASGWPCQHLRLPHPNLSGARNAGMRVARGEWIAIPDDDCWYEADTLAKVHERVRSATVIDGVVIQWVEQAENEPQGQDAPLSLDAWRRFKGGDASSITLFMRSASASSLAGFDERMGVGQWFGAGEETDLLLRMLAQGAAIERLSSARVHHAFGKRAARGWPDEYRQVRNRARGWGALCAKHQLPVTTTLRGLIGPLLWPLVRPDGWAGVVNAAGVFVGRWQGYVSWLLRSSETPEGQR